MVGLASQNPSGYSIASVRSGRDCLVLAGVTRVPKLCETVRSLILGLALSVPRLLARTNHTSRFGRTLTFDQE